MKTILLLLAAFALLAHGPSIPPDPWEELHDGGQCPGTPGCPGNPTPMGCEMINGIYIC